MAHMVWRDYLGKGWVVVGYQGFVKGFHADKVEAAKHVAREQVVEDLLVAAEAAKAVVHGSRMEKMLRLQAKLGDKFDLVEAL